MTQYVNKTKEQKQIKFTDGSSVFLKRGQKYSSTKAVKKLPLGVVELKDTKKTASVTKKETEVKESE